jgi:PIN domain nuclease of toxin-antitoxin system
MRTICDTHVVLFWAHAPARLTPRASEALEVGRGQGSLAIADISLWELALLQERGRLILPEGVAPALYVQRLLEALRLEVLPITVEIALLSRSALFQHGDPADRLIGATALQGRSALISADAKLRAIPELEVIW